MLTWKSLLIWVSPGREKRRDIPICSKGSEKEITEEGWGASRRRVIFSFSILAGGFLIIQTLALCATDFQTRTHDVDGHIEHLRNMRERLSLIPSKECWQCYHPPLYYWAGGLFLRVVSLFHLPEEKMLQVLSFATFWVYAIYGVKTLLTRRSFWKTKLLGVALFLFWPSNFIHSVRIGNDVLFYAFAAAAIAYTDSWVQKAKSADLVRALLAGACSVFVKANGFVIVAVVMITMAFPGRSTGKKQKLTDPLWLFAILTAFLTVYCFLMIVKTKGGVFTNASHLGSGLSVNSGILSFTFHDLLTFFTSIYTSPWLDSGGRQNFWVYTLKTSMFGEFSHEGQLTNFIALLLSAMCLPLLGFGLIGAYASVSSRSDHLHVINVCLSVVALGINRVCAPFACSNDFRYIFPAIISSTVLIMKGFEWSQLKPGFSAYARYLVIVFSVFGFLFAICAIFKF
jgi:hypothetical protein